MFFMLSIFPDLLTFGLVAPFLLRLALGFTFLGFGWGKLTREREEKSRFFEEINLKPGKVYALAFGLAELVGAILLIVGLFTQIVAIVFALISLGSFFIKSRRPNVLSSSKEFLAILFIISLSLLFSGPGFFAFDLPL